MRTSATRERRVELFRQKYRVDENGCWLWTGGVNDQGYGTFFDGRTRRAHRWAYEMFVGPIEPGMTLDHLCNVRRCVNPDHLESVTLSENLSRGHQRRGVRCPHGQAQCLVCGRERNRRYRQTHHKRTVNGVRRWVKREVVAEVISS